MCVPFFGKDIADELRNTFSQLCDFDSSRQVARVHDGYDANALLEQIFKIANDNSMEKQTVFSEIMEIVSIGLLRGNIREDQIEKTVPEGKTRIKELIKKWGFYTRKNAKEKSILAPMTLTFSRMILLFPHFASLILFRNPVKFGNRFPDNSTRYPAQTFKLPIAMKHLGFGGLIPTGVGNLLHNEILEVASLAFMVEFSIMVNPSFNKTFLVAYEGQKPYMHAAKNCAMPGSDRIAFLISLGLDTVESITRIVEVANSAMVACGAKTRYTMSSFQPLTQGTKIKIIEDDTLYAHAVAGASGLAAAYMGKTASSSQETG
ncbi:uncharacterized protein LOC113305348 [Papaver somniferum]|uniref:uncharacterized protein LOC113305348 n=1 Tax=Papaver somniferum TaxID=3469 RepID=UPI000E6F8BED|nr:uncharacterized protein LOC113305348 [Papaver somniferum]